jgi:hypothetical protein
MILAEVKIHTDADAAKSAQSINALAYTTGNNIVFNRGQYDPGTDNGKRLLSHELTHVIQQKGNNTQIQRTVSDADAEAEMQKWADAKKQKLIRTTIITPHLLWDFVYSLTFDNSTFEPIPKPKDAAKLKVWEHNWEVSEVIAKWLFNLKTTGKSDTIKSAAESRAKGVLDAMVQSGSHKQGTCPGR